MGDPTHYLIPAGMLQAILDYLARRPFVEVADAIGALRNLEPASQTEPQPATETATAD